MDEMKAEVEIGSVEKAGTKGKKKRRSGCGCIILLMVLGLLFVMALPQAPVEPPASLAPATAAYLEKAAKEKAGAKPVATASKPAAAPAVPEEPMPKYSVKVDQDLQNIKLVLKVALDVELDKLPNEKTLEVLSRSIFKDKGGDAYPRVFLVYSLPQLDPMPNGYWARVDFTPEITVSIFGVTSEDGKWMVAQREMHYDKPGTVVGRWYDLGAIPHITTLMKDRDGYFEYQDYREGSKSAKEERSAQNVHGEVLYKSTREADKELHWCIDKEGRWCMYKSDKLLGLQMPLKVKEGGADSTTLEDVAGDDAAKKATDGRKLLNINTATYEQLRALPGIDKVLAGRIIEYRKEHPFEDIYELDRIKGIGEKRMASVENLVTVE